MSDTRNPADTSDDSRSAEGAASSGGQQAQDAGQSGAGSALTDAHHDWLTGFLGFDTRTRFAAAGPGDGDSGGGLFSALANAASAVGGAVSGAASSAVDAVESAAGAAADTLATVASRASEVAASAASTAADIGSAAIDAAGEIGSAAVGAAQTVADFDTGLVKGLYEGGKGTVTGLAHGAEAVAKEGYALATDAQARSDAADAIEGAAKSVGAFGATVVTDPDKALDEVGGAIESGAETVANVASKVYASYEEAAAAGAGAGFLGEALGEGVVLVGGAVLTDGASVAGEGLAVAGEGAALLTEGAAVAGEGMAVAGEGAAVAAQGATLATDAAAAASAGSTASAAAESAAAEEAATSSAAAEGGETVSTAGEQAEAPRTAAQQSGGGEPPDEPPPSGPPPSDGPPSGGRPPPKAPAKWLGWPPPEEPPLSELPAETVPEKWPDPPDDLNPKIAKRWSEASGPARQTMVKAAEAEPGLTASVEGATEDLGGKMIGLKYRLKGAESLTRKVATDMANLNLDAEQAAGGINDAVRYTAAFPPDKLSDGALSALEKLKAEGNEVVQIKNTWLDPKKSYKGVNVQMLGADGQPFEVQFHTPESFWAKDEGTHAIFEQMRQLDPESPEWAKLNEQQMEIARSLKVPDGIDKIQPFTKGR